MDTNSDKDVVEVLLEQHDRIRTLCRQVQHVKGADKQNHFLELVTLLTQHEKGEQATVHAALRAAGGADGSVADARVDEENDASEQLQYLIDLGVDGPGFNIKFDAFCHMVVQHAASEEQQEFPRLREHLSNQQRADLAEDLRSVQNVA